MDYFYHDNARVKAFVIQWKIQYYNDFLTAGWTYLGVTRSGPAEQIFSRHWVKVAGKVGGGGAEFVKVVEREKLFFVLL